MKTKPQLLLNFVAAMVAILCLSCESKTFIGEKVAALDADAWNSSIWLSAQDAPVLEKWNHDRAADGASWFVSTITNEQKVNFQETNCK